MAKKHALAVGPKTNFTGVVAILEAKIKRLEGPRHLQPPPKHLQPMIKSLKKALTDIKVLCKVVPHVAPDSAPRTKGR